eukprot:1793629-Amphidinium_carterae.1
MLDPCEENNSRTTQTSFSKADQAKTRFGPNSYMKWLRGHDADIHHTLSLSLSLLCVVDFESTRRSGRPRPGSSNPTKPEILRMATKASS